MSRTPTTTTAYAWRCSRAVHPDQCGWTGDAQTSRAGPPLRPQQVAWIDEPWCPRCGEAAVPWKDGETIYPEPGTDVPSGIQPDPAVVNVPRAELEAVLALSGAASRAEYSAAVEALRASLSRGES
jgi:hypothetical protein